MMFHHINEISILVKWLGFLSPKKVSGIEKSVYLGGRLKFGIDSGDSS